MLKKLIVFFMMMAMLPAKGFAEQIHTIQPGDTFWKISIWYEVGLPELIEANPKIVNPTMIYPGQEVIIPGSSGKDETKSSEHVLIELTNQERVKIGLKPLEADRELDQAALKKSQDMRERNVIEHKSPTYGTLDEMITGFGIKYEEAAQNIAAGQRTPEEVVRDAMDNPNHRANILNGEYTHIGIGHAQGGPYGHYWTIIFIKK